MTIQPVEKAEVVAQAQVLIVKAEVLHPLRIIKAICRQMESSVDAELWVVIVDIIAVFIQHLPLDRIPIKRVMVIQLKYRTLCRFPLTM